MATPSTTTADNIGTEEKGLRLLVVSNRLPVTVKRDPATNQYEFKMSSGGLVAALSGLKKMMSFTWIGWPGITEKEGETCLLQQELTGSLSLTFATLGQDIPLEERKNVEERLLKETSTMPVFVDQELADLHYNGFSNR